MRREGFEYQSDSTGQEHDHHNRAEETGCLKINVEVHQNSGEDDHDSDEQKQPAYDGFTVEEQNSDADDERDQRQAEHTVPTKRPEATDHHDAICDQVGAGYCHRQAQNELSNATWRTAGASNSAFVVHGVIRMLPVLLICRWSMIPVNACLFGFDKNDVASLDGLQFF